MVSCRCQEISCYAFQCNSDGKDWCGRQAISLQMPIQTQTQDSHLRQWRTAIIYFIQPRNCLRLWKKKCLFFVISKSLTVSSTVNWWELASDSFFVLFYSKELFWRARKYEVDQQKKCPVFHEVSFWSCATRARWVFEGINYKMSAPVNPFSNSHAIVHSNAFFGTPVLVLCREHIKRSPSTSSYSQRFYPSTPPENARIRW